MLSANIGRVKGSFRLSGSTEHRRAPGSYSWQDSSCVELTEYFNKYRSCEDIYRFHLDIVNRSAPLTLAKLDSA